MKRNLQKRNHYKSFPDGAQFAKYHSKVGLDHGAGHLLLLLYDAKTLRGQKIKEFNGLGDDPRNAFVSLFWIVTKYFIRITI
jgi:hypothetical protein